MRGRCCLGWEVTQSPSLIKRISAPGNEIEGDPSSRGRLSSYKRALALGALVIKVGKQRCCSFNCSSSCKTPSWLCTSYDWIHKCDVSIGLSKDSNDRYANEKSLKATESQSDRLQSHDSTLSTMVALTLLLNILCMDEFSWMVFRHRSRFERKKRLSTSICCKFPRFQCRSRWLLSIRS